MGRWSTASRHKRGYGSAWDRIRATVLSDEPLCRPCRQVGRITAATEVDHVVPKAKGGGDEAGNLQPICKACHADKTIRDRGQVPRPEIGLDGWPVVRDDR